jgi:aspartate-semialdehyde dehydrogenase
VDSIGEHHPEYVLLCADAETSRHCKTVLEETESILIDNSSAFRLDESVPLVIPEVNSALLEPEPRFVANPNCSTIMLLTAISPIHEAFWVRRISVTTYQAVSGAGIGGLDELHAQTRARIDGTVCEPRVFPVSCAFDVFEHESLIDPDTGFNGEESKMIAESRKIWAQPGLRILPTCVRVPVERAHAQAITLELSREACVDELREVLRTAPGVRLHSGDLPLTPAQVAGTDDVVIGRIRIDPDDPLVVTLWVCCDQIRKGAALNALQIMDRLVQLRAGSVVAH